MLKTEDLFYSVKEKTVNEKSKEGHLTVLTRAQVLYKLGLTDNDRKSSSWLKV